MANDFSGDANCVALWRFEDDPGFNIDSIGDNDLTDNDTVQEENTIIKEAAQSAYFSNSNNEYFSSTDGALDAGFPGKDGSGTISFSVCFWLRWKYDGTDRGVIDKVGSNLGFRILVDYTGAANVIKFLVGNGTGNDSASFGTGIAKNLWYHVTCTYDSADNSYRIRVWSDNASDQLGADVTGTFSLAAAPSTEDMLIGKYAGGVELDGYLDEMVVFKDVLSTGDIDEIRAGTYGAAAGGVPMPLIVSKMGGGCNPMMTGL